MYVLFFYQTIGSFVTYTTFGYPDCMLSLGLTGLSCLPLQLHSEKLFVSTMAGCSQTFLKICVYFNFVIVICLNTLCNINQPCDVIDWTPWSPCSTTGEQSSKSIICCTGLDKGRCLRICSWQMRPEMKERKRNCIPRSTPYVYIVPLASTRFITSRSKTVRSFTENATSAFHPSTIDTATKTGRVTIGKLVYSFLSTIEKYVQECFQILVFV